MTKSKLKYILVFVCTMTSITSFAQVINGSFENGSSADLSGWEWTCGAESVEDAPPGGGSWCIKVAGGNVKGCFPGFAYQKIPGAIAGQPYTLSGWVHSESSRTVGLYFGTIHKDTITTQAGDTTTSNAWKQLSIESSFTLSEGDTAIVVLFGGIAAGPFQGFGYFDLIKLEETTGIYSIEEQSSFRIYPNPFSSESTLQSDRPFKDACISVYDVNGQLVREERHISGSTYSVRRGDLRAGLYNIRITEGVKIVGLVRMVIMGL
jgi:hypothetical protein